MICPRCEVPLVETRLEDLVLDKCERCGGVWFDFAEFDWVGIKSRDKVRRALTPQRGVEMSAANGEDRLVCPRCGKELLRVRSAEDTGLLVEACLSCYGQWVDGDELDRAQNRSVWGKLRQLFREVL